MGFVASASIISETDLASITHEGLVANLDDDHATLTAILPEATNAIMRALKKRSIDPALVTNTTDFRAAAAYWVLWTVFAAQPQSDEENVRKAADYKSRWESEIATIVVETATTTASPRGLPSVLNLDAVPYVNNGIDNRAPQGFPRGSRDLGPFFETD
jgi:hypothetical protein